MKSILALVATALLVGSVVAKSGDATWYNLGLTACGQVFNDNDLVAATAFGYWTTPNPNVDPMCRRRARVTANGKSVVVAIKDKCSGCSMNDIDLSPAAFKRLAALGQGRIRVNWEFI